MYINAQKCLSELSNFTPLFEGVIVQQNPTTDSANRSFSLHYICMETALFNYFLENQVELSYDYTIELNSSTYCLYNDGLQENKVL